MPEGILEALPAQITGLPDAPPGRGISVGTVSLAPFSCRLLMAIAAPVPPASAVLALSPPPMTSPLPVKEPSRFANPADPELFATTLLARVSVPLEKIPPAPFELLLAQIVLPAMAIDPAL